MDSDQRVKGKDYVYLEFNPVWECIPFTRQYIQKVLSVYLKDHTTIDRIVLCVSELLENAMKYCSQPGIRLLLSHLEKKGAIEIRVYNHAKQKQIEHIQKVIKQLNATDPLEGYLAKIKETANKVNGQSEIGLARIQYEAKAIIQCFSYKNTELEIKVTLKANEQGGD
jgi:hypothetical protein